MRRAASAMVKAHQGNFSKLLVAGSSRPSPTFSVEIVKGLSPLYTVSLAKVASKEFPCLLKTFARLFSYIKINRLERNPRTTFDTTSRAYRPISSHPERH